MNKERLNKVLVWVAPIMVAVGGCGLYASVTMEQEGFPVIRLISGMLFIAGLELIIVVTYIDKSITKIKKGEK